mmetsp:Transcript_5660/g.16827  ORF Transcript_5660/g.16827 Transcript_5660/m.16827 type:complete len:268 (+) Transcript_5660:377-1180(+)|eukprot:CAMPEP_0198728680 /NCGR_PEP_ID=MMETSP1475-20131203/10883_1 /TAXON_ID= ORGANISM="Unidentified sp., Strain CCMP1999" /NCGR_SAMPLE_ID=MMETSP1475 /ASSEMBLY_ACC=CAM_ASM_001111 /LENGTH=267 /DNA_ID=CAMNT_0044491117 /DNA_START=368 /DNA_END=1171 /DNA_ORIENTATION=+
MEELRTPGPSVEERKAMVKKKLAMRGLEQRKIYDSADASMNKSAMDKSKSRAAGGARDQNTQNRPSLQRTAISRSVRNEGGTAPRASMREPIRIGQKVAARGNQQAAETGSLTRKTSSPTSAKEPAAAPDAAKKQVQPAKVAVEKGRANEPAANEAQQTPDKEKETQVTGTKTFQMSSFGARSPLDMASLLSNVQSGTANSTVEQKHIRLPTVAGGNKEITVNTNDGSENNKLLDAASLLRHWNDMKASHSKPETKSSLGLAVMAHR